MKLISHDDLDGVVSAVLLSLKFKTNNIHFQDSNKSFKANKNTIISDLPYEKGTFLWFDHHISHKTNQKFKGKFALEKSCARVIYDYYNKKFPKYYEELVVQTDKADSGDYSLKDIKTYNFIYLLDRIGFLSPFNNEKERQLYLKTMFTHFKEQKPIKDLLKNKDIKKFIDRVKKIDKKSLEFIKKYGRINKKTLIIDSSDKERIFNPFYIYTKYLDCKYMMIITKRGDKLGILLIFNKFYPNKNHSNIGEILKKYGGGGHSVIGGCRIYIKNKKRVVKEILNKLK
ncbi:MAG: hypothetical protein WC413_04045 [Candidatus Nanoarchaeia archaeon]